MSFRVSGKNIEIGEALRERISARVLESLAKYFDGGFSGHATIGKEAFGFRAECVVHLDSGVVLRADAMAADPYLSADQAAERLDKRLRRYHRRLKDYRADGNNGSFSVAQDDKMAALNPGGGDADGVAHGPVVIAESPGALRRLSVSEAVMELDMTSVPVMVFRHAGHGRVNLVYRRADGNVGWIDPATDPTAASAGGH